jgi:hypothetical protein
LGGFCCKSLPLQKKRPVRKIRGTGLGVFCHRLRQRRPTQAEAEAGLRRRPTQPEADWVLKKCLIKSKPAATEEIGNFSLARSEDRRYRYRGERKQNPMYFYYTAKIDAE